MTAASATDYDQVKYPGFAFPQTRPDRLSSVARLFGVRTAPVEESRVLELGCGDGTNLLAMAIIRPNSEFVGIDASVQAIATANTLARGAGVSNIRFLQLGVEDLPPELGEFNYVIAHGLYSWVGPRTRDALLASCREHLSSSGVAYVSYNAYPGSFLRDMVREVLEFHVDGVSDAWERVRRARRLAELIVDANVQSAHGRAMGAEMAALLDRSDPLLAHDDLAAVNTPVFFHEFIAHARAHDLQFLSESDLLEGQPLGLPPTVQQAIEQLSPDVVLREQYLDFVKNRAFRQTLLCRTNIAIDREFDATRLGELAVASRLRPTSEPPDLQHGVSERFRGLGEQSVQTADPLAKAALIELAHAAPRALPFVELEVRVGARLAGAEVQSSHCSAELAPTVLQLCLAGVVELWSKPPPLAAKPHDRPRSSELARAQLAQGRSTVASLLHTNVTLEDPVGRSLVSLLDGTRDRERLLRELSSVVGLTTPADELPQALDASLRQLAELGLLWA